MLDPIFFLRRTEPHDQTGTDKVLRTNTLLLCRGMRKRLSFVVFWLARPKTLDGFEHAFLPRNVANGHEQPRSVPSGSTRSNRVKTRPRMWSIPGTGGKEFKIMSCAVFSKQNFPNQAQGRQSLVFYT